MALRNATRFLFGSVVCVVAAGCGGGGDGGGLLCPTNNPPPRISGSPPSVATVGQQYRYTADLSYSCLIFIVPAICGAPAEAAQLPPGAQVASRTVLWTPSASDVNRNVSFAIQTPADLCGGRARQSWTVTVHPMPTIQSFTASKSTVAVGETVTLTAVFEGSGAIEGLGTVTSGVPITTEPLLTDKMFRLDVFNNAGTKVSQFASVDVLSPPAITSFTATPSTIGIGSSTTLRWDSNGDISQVRITPPGIDVPRSSSLVVTPSATTTYVLTASNQFTSVDRSVEVTVIPAANIRSFGATPASSAPGGTVTLSADFDGTNGRIEQELNGIYTTLAAVNSGDVIAAGPLYRSTRYRLSVQNSVGMVVTRDLLVALSGPGTFQPTTGQPLVPTRSYHTATLLLDGRVLIAGGTAGVSSRSTEIFDPATQTFALGPNLLSDRVRHHAVLLLDGRVLIGSGCGSLPSCHPTEVFDPSSGTFVVGPSVPGGVAGMARLADGRVLIALGLPDQFNPYAAVTFNPSDGSLSALIPSVYPFALRMDGSNALTPMTDGRILSVNTASLQSEIFTPGPDSFSPAAPPNVARLNGIAVTGLLDGRVLITGGAVPPGTVAEAYSPQLDRFVALTSQQIAAGLGAYANQTGTRLQDGRVLLVGGNNSPFAQLFDPASNTFSATGGLLNGRGVFGGSIRTFTSTLLGDGRVLVVGGCDGTLTCEAELYTP